jgi:hypothetical protein
MGVMYMVINQQNKRNELWVGGDWRPQSGLLPTQFVIF